MLIHLAFASSLDPIVNNNSVLCITIFFLSLSVFELSLLEMCAHKFVQES